MRIPITVNTEIYRVINRAIVTFTLLFDVTSNDFRPNSMDLGAQPTSGEVLAEFGS